MIIITLTIPIIIIIIIIPITSIIITIISVRTKPPTVNIISIKNYDNDDCNNTDSVKGSGWQEVSFEFF